LHILLHTPLARRAARREQIFLISDLEASP
jgi:hypothetical protein